MLMAFCFIAMIAASASAESFKIGYKAIDDKANLFEPATFEVTIQNMMSISDSYRLSFVNDPRWSIQTDPLSDRFSGMDVKALSASSTTVKIMPIILMSYGRYNMIMTVKSGATGDEQSIILPVFVTAVPYGQQYALTTKMGADISQNNVITKDINPQQPIKITVSIENRMPAKRSGLKLQMSDELGLFSEEKIVDLDTLEKKMFSFVINLNPAQAPAEDALIVRLYTSDDILVNALDRKSFSIVPYSAFEESQTVKNRFLRTDTIITVMNTGNEAGSYIVKRKVDFFTNLFLRTNPKAKWMTIDNEKYLAWPIQLEAQAQTEILMAKTYRGFVLLLLITAALIIIYYYFRSPIVVRKKAGITRMKEGGISELKVLVSLRNRTTKSIEGVKVVDAVPDIADIEKNFEAGTLKPESISKHAIRGTLIKWDLGTLDRLEERVISYKVRAKLSIIGYFTLPPVVVKYIYRNKESITTSNKIRLEVAESPEE